MGLLEDITSRMKASNLIGALAAEFFPEALAGFLNESLSGVSAKEFYHKLRGIEGRGLLGFLNEGAKVRLKGIIPEDLSWFTLEWFVKAIYEEHPDIVNLILSSEYVKNEIERQINIFKEECAR